MAEYIRPKNFCNKKIKSRPAVKLFSIAFLGVTSYFTLFGVYPNVCLSYQVKMFKKIAMSYAFLRPDCCDIMTDVDVVATASTWMKISFSEKI